ncbi:hypothetical protein Javan207_0039 [Streptococcus phage Javan207]|uniref:CopG family transcriptional regulator n=1 Tax=Streptococcus equinus JB1 TaxID=1294274 RepID=A0A1I4FH55_STREI|nr:hypothetical protein [Streptococcus equinus]QBX15725.1 hypothetical protein Javan207_0039 [Streptococcus phage Javan207]SFL16267.1 hypothetical protein SAMN02910290_00713 [Streptococcus equinus JB1]
MQDKKRPRGRPATGRERNISMTMRVTEKEREIIKLSQKEHNKKSVVDLLLHFIEKNK